MYKQSKFNYYLPAGDLVYYINTLSGVKIPLKKEEHLKIKKLFADPITFELEYPSVFKQFCDWGFIVDSRNNETLLFYYSFMDKKISDDNLLISVILEKDFVLNKEFLSRIANYIYRQMEISNVQTILIEWNGNHLPSYIGLIQTFIEELTSHIKISITNYFNLVLGCNRHIHNRILHQKGSSTFEAYLKEINKISETGKINLMLIVPDDRLGSETIENKLIGIEEIKLQKKPFDNDLKTQTVGKIIYINQDRIMYPRKLSVIISSNDNLFSDYLRLMENTPVGILDPSGMPKWNRMSKQLILSRPWFDNTLCNKCPILPLMVNICPKFQLSTSMTLCPVKNKIIKIESIIHSLV